MVHVLEKRGYVKAGLWTPECTVEHPEAGQLVCHKESIEIAKQSFVIRSFFAYYYFFVFFFQSSIVRFQKISIPTPQKVNEICRVRVF